MTRADTPKTEKTYFRWQAPRNYRDDQRFDCRDCWDSGWRVVWHGKSEYFASQAKLGADGEYLPYGEFVWELHAATAAARCPCRHGDKHPRTVGQYNPLTMALYDPLASREENLASLMELVNRPPVATPFDGEDWSNR